MDYTPDSGTGLLKKHLYSRSSFDSGYSDVQSFSGKTNGAKCAPCRYLSPEDYYETPKENLRVTPKKKRATDATRLSGNESRRMHQPSAVGWCETPKTSKKDGILRRRLTMGNAKSTTDAKPEGQTSPCAKVIEASLRLGGKHNFTAKRRLFYAQVKTSTHEYGRNAGDNLERNISLSSNADLGEHIGSFGHCATEQLGTPRLGDFLPALESKSCQTPVNMVAASPGQSPCAQNTPSAAITPTYVRYVPF